jgi:hypothetical protein
MSWWNVANLAVSAYGVYEGTQSSKGGGGTDGGDIGRPKPIDIAELFKATAKGFKEAAPDIIEAEKAMRPAMQDLALDDARRALMGGDAALRTERDTAEAAVTALEAGLSMATSEIQSKMTEVRSRSFNVEVQRDEWNTHKRFIEGEKKKTNDLLSNFLSEKESAKADSSKLGKFKTSYPTLIDSSTGKLKKENEVSIEEYNRLGASGRPWRDALESALAAEKNLVEWDSGKKYDWLEKQAAQENFKDVTSYLRNLDGKYTRDINTLTSEIGAEGEDIATYEPYVRAKQNFDEKKEADLGVLASQIENLKITGQFSDENYEVLKGEFEDAAAAVLEGSPGILDLAEYSINRQAALGERLKEAAAKNEFRVMQELAPELVEMYRETNKPAVTLADIVSEQAKLMIDSPNRSYTDQQKDLTKLRGTLGLPPVEDSLEAKVAKSVSDFIDKESLGSPEIQKQLSDKVGSLMAGPAAGEAEKALYGAAFDAPGVRKGPSAEAQALTKFGETQLAPELAARGPSEAEKALGITAKGGLTALLREAGLGEEAIAQKGLEMLNQVQADPSAVQGAMATAATGGLGADLRGASVTEQALGTAARGGLTQAQRTAGLGEQALTQAGLGMLGRQAPEPSQVQQTMADAAIRDMGAGARGASPLETALGVSGMRGMDAEARGASDIEQALSASSMRGMDADVRAASDVERALGLSAMRGMDAQQRAASPEEAALQARIAELIGGAGTLSPLERRQVEQEMLALQQRQGRARDTGAAAAVTGRMAEARRADLGQDLGLASGLLGQQDALIQARVQEQLQALGLGQQGAVGVAGMEATRQNELMRQRTLAQEGAISVAGLEAGRQDEMLREQALGQQGVLGAAGLETVRQDEMLRQRALGQQAGVSAEQIALAQAQQGIAERQAGAGFLGEAERFEEARVQEQLQRQATAQQGAFGTAQLETARQAELLQTQAQGIQAGATAEQMELARQQQAIVEAQAGAGMVSEADALEQARINELLAQQQTGAGMTATASQIEAQRQAEFQAQQGMGLQAVTQAGGLTLQQTQQELAALEAVAQRESARESQLLQGVGLAAGISQEQFKQSAITRDLEREGLVTGAAITADIADRDLREQGMISSILGQEQSMESRRIAENYAREQQGLGAAGQAFAMQTSVAPDVTSYFGRPASQTAGMAVLGAGQQQAQYGTDPKTFDYGVGVNVAMVEQANLTALQSAQISADAAKKAGIYGGAGNILSSLPWMDIFGGGGGTTTPSTTYNSSSLPAIFQ